MKFIKYIVSIPRSGQHFAESSLRTYYEKINRDDFNYCHHYKSVKNPNEPPRCTCGSIPCKRDPNSYLKNHDFGTNAVSVNQHGKYLFLYRDSLVNQMDAWYRLHVSGGGGWKAHMKSRSLLNYENRRVLRGFENFCNKEKPYMEGMYDKWLNPADNILTIKYEQLIESFCDEFKKILIFFEVEIDEQEIVNTRDVVDPKLNWMFKSSECYQAAKAVVDRCLWVSK